MRYHEIAISEGAQEDLGVDKAAKLIIDRLLAYFRKYKALPLKMIPKLKVLIDETGVYYVFDLERIAPDLKDYPDLSFGLRWWKNDIIEKAPAWFVQSQGRGYIITNCDNDDPRETNDVEWLFDQEHLAHELVHYFDWKRFKRPADWNNMSMRAAKNRALSPPTSKSEAQERLVSQQRAYYNNAKEMNAYYGQGVNKIINDLLKAQAESMRYAQEDPEWGAYLAAAKEFESFQERYWTYFDWGWRSYLSASNKKRVQKRFYKLFLFIRENWPNIDRVADEAKHIESFALAA